MNDRRSLEGKTILIFGGGRGLGRAVAICSAQAGADVAVVSRTESEISEVVAEITKSGRRGLALVGDAREPVRVEGVVGETIREFGKIDVLVNCQGESLIRPVADTTMEDFDRMVDANLRSVYVTCKAVIVEMTKQGSGHIINISSRVGIHGAPSVTAYTAAKAGVIGLSKALALELKGSNIKVNVVCPAPMDTPMRWEATPEFDRTKVISPESVAELVVLLASMPDSSMEGVVVPTSINL